MDLEVEQLNSEEPLDLSKPHQQRDIEVSRTNCERHLRQKSSTNYHGPFAISNILKHTKPSELVSNDIESPRTRRSPSTEPEFPIPSVRTNVFTSASFRPILRTRGKERALLTCSVCSKGFDRPSLLKRHLRVHTGEKPHVCDVCCKGFSTSSSLNTHRRIHSGEKPHACQTCGKRFTASSNLYYHRMTHNKEKPHKCPTPNCGKSFPTPGDLKSHQYVHSGTWPFKCSICQRGFSKQTNLRNHILLHSGDKPYSCTTCGKKFALSCNLRAHLKTHEEDLEQAEISQIKRSKCTKCQRWLNNTAIDSVTGQCRTCTNYVPPSTIADSNEFSRLSEDIKPEVSSNSASSDQMIGESKITTFTSSVPSSESLSHFPSRNAFEMPQNPEFPLNTLRIPAPNPFLEQLLTWNSQFVRDYALHQGILESIFTAQFLGSSQNQSGVLPGFLFEMPLPSLFPAVNHDWSSPELLDKTQ